MFKYRPGEGVYARGAAFWALAGFAFLYARRLYLWLDRYDVMRRVLAGEIPVVGTPLTPRLLISLAVFAGLTYAAWRFVNGRKMGDLLVETELEMKKVTWPSFDETRKASLVVMACVAIMVAFLWLSDLGLEKFFFGLVYGGGTDGR